ncbi:uncharacterized protein LOC135197593 isoform X1 [Macrobrachium nipponense]|uniref:uncharacterized protein LOC135197593 isoform X1 n=1 Tax=Macrobrachium nipponense TaxID=159736 RepID=UPI0030C7C4C3
MVSDRVVLLLAVFRLHVALCIPVLQENPEISSRQARSVSEPQYPVLGRLSQDGSQLKQWDLPHLMDEEDYPATYVKSRPDVHRAHHLMEIPARPRPENSHTHRRTLDYPLTKRNEETNIPTMGLGKRSSPYDPYVSVGVLSDMRKFFNDLRVNLDSVEEAAGMSQEQGGFKNGAIDPSDFLSFLSKHGARSSETTSAESGLPRNPTHIRRLMFGYNHDDQPYIHSGLGK